MPLLFLNAAFVFKEQLLFLHSFCTLTIAMFSLSSYCNLITFCCSHCQSYNKGIPSYFLLLWQASGIILTLFEKVEDYSVIWFFRHYLPRERSFLVLSFTDNLSKCYEVYFGNEHEIRKAIKLSSLKKLSNSCQAAMARIKQFICADIFCRFLEICIIVIQSWHFA